MKRRVFLKQAAWTTGMALAAPGLGWAGGLKSAERLTILHTNDWHSRIDPFPEGDGRNGGKGGALRRAALIDRIRAEEPNVLLLDSGDVFQGTPYFNFFGGELEFKLMSGMKYDAGTIGNHDFDAGLEGLAKQLPHANFPLLSANYDFSKTILDGKTQSWLVLQRGPFKVGIFGLGLELKGLVPEKLYGNTVYQDPVEKANRTALHLHERERCDLVICLSHLGLFAERGKVNDRVLAAQSRHVDVILGGHTHTFMSEPELAANRQGEPVLINQVGWAGLRLGRLDIAFDRNRRRRMCTDCSYLEVV